MQSAEYGIRVRPQIRTKGKDYSCSISSYLPKFQELSYCVNQIDISIFDYRICTLVLFPM